MAEQYIQSAKELREYFFNIRKRKTFMDRGVMIGAGIRRNVLTDIHQGRITLDGRVRMIAFDNMGGGVYRAHVKEL